MLRFEIQDDDVVGPWSFQSGRWRCGSSWVEPVRSPALCAAGEFDSPGPGGTITVRELRPDGDFLELVLSAGGTLGLQAGPTGVAPLYVAAAGSRLIGSWDPADLARFASFDGLSPVVVARLLTRCHRYSTDTLFSQISRLTAGATLTWHSTEGPSIRYPPDSLHVVEPRLLRPGVDPVDCFEVLMDRNVQDVCSGHDGPVAVELSGGLDSANVAVAVVKTARHPVLSGGLLLAGVAGQDQRDRRQIMTGHLGLRDIPVVAAEHLPLAPGGPRSVKHVHYPDTDVYQEAFDSLRAALRGAGARVVFTGFGGDEIMSRTPSERSRPTAPPRPPPWLDERTRAALAGIDANCSPVTNVALPTLVVFAARHPAYLRAGLWPIAPFSAPDVSEFGRSLPVEWRSGKELLRQRLARTGLPPTVTHPHRPESFAPTMRLALRRHASSLLADMLDGSALVTHGFVRRRAVEHLYGRARDGHTVPSLVYDMLALHIGIHSMCTSATAGKGISCTSSTPDR